MYQSSCFECNPSEVFDLETLSCIPECEANKVKILDSEMFKISGEFCREPNYYVDPTSEEILELGTKLYPYRTIKGVFAEILKHLSHQDILISIYLKEDTNVFIEDSTSFAINITEIKIQSYTFTSRTPQKATIITTVLPQPGLSGRAAFHIMKDVSLNLTAVIEGRPFLDYEINTIGRQGDGLQIIRSSISMDNIIARRQAIDKMNGVFIFLLYLQEKTIRLGKY